MKKLRQKESILLKHQEKNTIPTVIFGGKKNFYERMRNNISKEKWKELRSNMLYSRGDQSKKGNLNTRIVFDENEQQFYVEIANPLQGEAGKKSPRLRFKIQIPDKYFEEIVSVVLPNITYSNGKAIEDFNMYSIEIKKKNKNYYIHITYDIETYGSELKWNEKITSDMVAGIDVNIDRVSVSILSKQGNLIESKTFYCHEMEYVKSNRRSNIAGEMAKEIIDYLFSWNVG